MKKKYLPKIEDLEGRMLLTAAASEQFVAQSYLDLTGMNIDPASLSTFSNLLDGGQSKTQVVRTMENSQSYQTLSIGWMYQGLMRSPIDPSSSQTYAKELASGSTLEQVASNILGSQDYFTTRGGVSTDGFLRSLVYDMVGRAITPAESASYGAELSGGVSRTNLALTLITNDESQNIYDSVLNETFLHATNLDYPLVDYAHIDRISLTNYANILTRSIRNEDLVASILGSNTYADRVSQSDSAATISVTSAANLTTTRLGGAAAISIKLLQAPTANVTINLSSSRTAVGVVSPSSVTFTPENWNVAQAITVTGVNDGQVGSTVNYSVLYSPALSVDPHFVAQTPVPNSIVNRDGLVASFDPSTKTISFNVSNTSVTTAVVLNSQGQIIRSLWSLQPTSAGSHTGQWDGLDDHGSVAPAGSYSIRMTANASSSSNVGAIGNSASTPNALNHTPVAISSVAIGPDGSIYTANAWDEEGADFEKWSPSGNAVYNANYQVRNGTPYGMPYTIATDGQYFYCAVLNLDSSASGKNPQLIERFRISDGSPAPWANGDPNGHISVYNQIPQGITNPLAAMATSSGSLWVVDSLGNRILRYDSTKGLLISQFSVQNPQAIAVDSSGQIWVGYGNRQVGILSLVNGSITNVLTDLVQVVSIAFGPDGKLYVADTGAGQVKIYSIQATQASLVQVLGQKAQPGDRAASDFYDLIGLSVGPDGSIVTIQKEPPNAGSRLAKFNAKGTLAWEQYGNEFVGIGTYGQNNPSQVYTDSFHTYTLTNETTGSWTYTNNTYSGQTISYGGQSPTGVPRILPYGNAEFYFEPTGDGLQVYRIEGNLLHLAALVGGISPGPDGLIGSLRGEWSWSDINGTGSPAAKEIQWFGQAGSYEYITHGMEVDNQGNIFFEDLFSGQVWEIPIGLPDHLGNPTYNWADRKVILPKDQSSFGLQVQSVQHADDGSYYVLGWSAAWPDPNSPLWMGGSTLVKFDAQGNQSWAVHLPEVCTGMDYVPGGGVMLGGGTSATIYQYASDGMLIGSVSPGAAMGGIGGWLDNQGSVAVDRNPQDGLLDIFVEDDENMNIGWYRVNNNYIQEISVSNVTPTPSPAAPTHFAVTPDQAGEIHLSWDAVAGTAGYVIERSSANGIWQQIIDLSPAATATMDTGLDPSTTYSYRITSLEVVDTFDSSALGRLPVQGAYAVASVSTTSDSINPLFKDDFLASSVPGSAWSFPHGTWTVTANGLSQTSSNASQTKALIVDQTYPANVQITAKLRVDTWANGDNNVRVGIGLNADGTLLGYGGGYFLNFDGDQHHVVFSNDEDGYGNSYAFDWNVGQWYWFSLESDNGTLYGKIWADGTEEPTAWQFTQSGWTNQPNGAPALCGGSVGNTGGYATASFNYVQISSVVDQINSSSQSSTLSGITSFEVPPSLNTTPTMPNQIAVAVTVAALVDSSHADGKKWASDRRALLSSAPPTARQLTTRAIQLPLKIDQKHETIF